MTTMPTAIEFEDARVGDDTAADFAIETMDVAARILEDYAQLLEEGNDSTDEMVIDTGYGSVRLADLKIDDLDRDEAGF